MSCLPRAKRGRLIPFRRLPSTVHRRGDCFIAALLAMTSAGTLRAKRMSCLSRAKREGGSEAWGKQSPRSHCHCERSEAISSLTLSLRAKRSNLLTAWELLRRCAPGNDTLRRDRLERLYDCRPPSTVHRHRTLAVTDFEGVCNRA